MDRISPEARSLNMSRIRSKDSRPEMAVRRALHALGFRYRLHVPGLPGKPDLVFPKLRKLIFVNGCFWHRHSCSNGRLPSTRPEFWLEKLNSNRARDLRNLRKLRRLGWKCLVVWECQTSANLSPAVLNRIVQFLR